MALDFHKQADEATSFLKGIAQDMNCPDDYNRAARILKSTLHAIRDIISPEESLQLLAQLPIFLKGVYVENWSFSRKQVRIHNEDELYELMHKYDWPVAHHDYPSKGMEAKAIQSVLNALSQYVSAGELDDIVSQLPKEVKPLFERVPSV